MKKTIVGLSITIIGALVSCKKDKSNTPPSALQQAVAQTEAIAVAPSTVTTGDSVYVINTSGATDSRLSIPFSSLPSVVNDYLNNSYNGYTAQLAFSTSDNTGALNGYDVVIQFNNKPAGIKFDATGAFIKVLEQSEGRDLLNNFWHTGGLFDGRDGLHRDTIAVAALPAAIQTYFTNTYPQDSLISAFATKAGDYLVLSQNAGLITSSFAADGSFISRIVPPEMQGTPAVIDAVTLPSAVTAYLNNAYPGYFFEKTFSINNTGTIMGYTLIIDANDTKYSLEFDAAGNYAASMAIL